MKSRRDLWQIEITAQYNEWNSWSILWTDDTDLTHLKGFF